MPEARHRLLAERTWFMVLLLVVLWPVGLALMWEEPRFPRGARIALSALVPVLSIALLVTVALAWPGSGDAGQGANASQSPTSTAVSVQAPVVTPPVTSTTVAPSQTATTDAAAPTTSISGIPSTWTTSTVTFTLTALDDSSGSGVAATFYTLNGSSPTTYTKAVSISTAGTTTVTYYSVDKAGNAETALSALVLIDKTPPTLSIGTNKTAIYTGTATVTASAADSMSGIKELDMRLDGKGGWTAIASLSTSVPGKHKVEAQAYDNAGNWRYVYKYIAVYGAPSLTIKASKVSTTSISASGTVVPKQKTNLTLVLQKYFATSKVKWQSAGSKTVTTGNSGTWAGTFTGLGNNTYRVQVQYKAHGYYKATTSGWAQVKI